MSQDALRRELGAFLRATRERVDPAEQGIAVTGRRRTPGLRREEVAAASGVGLAWYTWLEQGRVSTSRQVLDSLARSLRMDSEARRHLLALGGFAVDGDVSDETVVTELRPLLDSWPLTPALLLDHRFDVLAGNDAYCAVWPQPVLPIVDERPNVLLLIATSPVLRTMLLPEERLAYQLFLRFRARADRHSTDPGVQRVLAELRARRPDVTHWWNCRAVSESGSWPVTALVEDRRLRFVFSLLRPDADGEATLLVQAPADADTVAWIRGRTSSRK